MATPFPTKLSDLYHPDPVTTPNFYSTLKQLKRSTLSLHNRLSSILHDSHYITHTVHPSFPTLPLLANERCGSWYIPPSHKSGSAYFKSTDGHYGAWDFSLRRLNLQVLEVLGRDQGAVLVDSTRRGKRMPDALRRTVPVWVLVWNWVLFQQELGGLEEWEWAFRLQHPGLEPAEVKLIEAKLKGWVDGLKGLGLDLEAWRRKVARPIRLCLVIHGEEIPELDRHDGSNLLILCSASRIVLGAEMSEDGYVQGAADDAESWSGGLTSAIFWQHKDELMSAAEEDRSDLIAKFVEAEKLGKHDLDAVQIKPTRNMFIAAGSPQMSQTAQAGAFDLVVNCNGKETSASSKIVNLGCRSGKLGSRDLRDKLPKMIAPVSKALQKNADCRILIMCENGKDLSIGVAVTVLCSLYDDEGRIIAPASNAVDKQLVKQRLAWITSMKPEANPSRSTLQSVNSFLMS